MGQLGRERTCSERLGHVKTGPELVRRRSTRTRTRIRCEVESEPNVVGSYCVRFAFICSPLTTCLAVHRLTSCQQSKYHPIPGGMAIAVSTSPIDSAHVPDYCRCARSMLTCLARESPARDIPTSTRRVAWAGQSLCASFPVSACVPAA